MGAPGRQERREDEKPPERRMEAGEERRGDTQGGSKRKPGQYSTDE